MKRTPPPTKPAKGNDAAHSSDDAACWESTLSGVTPLGGSKRMVPPAPSTAAVPVRMRSEIKTVSSALSTAQNLPPLIVGDTSTLDGTTAKRVRRGQYPIALTLDLHGMHQPVAQDYLKEQLHLAYARQRRCVLVITGKGQDNQSLRYMGVLRAQLPLWLNQPDIRPLVVACVHAVKQDGGEGAFYVLLKRKRQGRGE